MSYVIASNCFIIFNLPKRSVLIVCVRFQDFGHGSINRIYCQLIEKDVLARFSRNRWVKMQEQALITIMHMKIYNDHGSIALKKCVVWNTFF